MSRYRLLVGAAVVAVLLLPDGGRADARPPAAASKSLIYAGWFGNTVPTPSFIAANFAFLESRPFNGLVVYARNSSLTIDASKTVMSNTAISFADIESVLAPIKGLPFSRLTANFAYVVGTTPPDFFADWSIPVQNFANLAKALKEAGLKGVFFDNEQYFDQWAEYPGDDVTKTVDEYQTQARLRGKEVMQAMVAEYPDIVVLSMHGPYVSQPDAPFQFGFIIDVDVNRLMGPYFAGFHEGRGAQTRIVDGGEFYGLRTLAEFAGNRTYRRIDFPSDTVDCAFLTDQQKLDWTDSISLAYGVYDKPSGGRPMNPDVLTPTLQLALDHADHYAWFYTESMTFLKPESDGGAPHEWVNAVGALFPGFLPEGGGGGSSSGCGLMGIEFLPLLGFLALRRRR